jgi:hypothetical protein
MSKASLPILLALSFSSPALAASLYRRNLSCKDWTATRSNEICRMLEWEMEWTWTGHAVFSPSFRVTFENVRKTYCAISVSSQDTAALVDMVLGRRQRSRSPAAQRHAFSALSPPLASARRFSGRQERLGRPEPADCKNAARGYRVQQRGSRDDLESGQSSVFAASRLPLIASIPRLSPPCHKECRRNAPVRLTIFRALDKSFA